MSGRAASLVAVLCCLPLAAATARGDDASRRFYEGLRQRRLFGLAEGDLLSRLARGRLSERERGDLTLELSRTFIEHARSAGVDERAELWSGAASCIEDLLRQDPQNAWRVLLEFQRALVPAAQGELLRGQAELSPLDAELAGRARTALDDAIGRLERLADAVDVQLRQATSSRRAATDGLTPYELRTLLSQVRFHLGAARLEQAQAFPAESPDRASSLIDAEVWLKQVAGGPPGEPLTFHAQLLLAVSSRLRGDLKQSERLLAQIENDKPARDVADRVTAERVRLLLAADNPPDAAAVLSEYRRRHQVVPGELQYLNVEALAAAWEIARSRGDADLAQRILASVEEFTARAAREAGGYWGYRSQVRLEALREQERHGPDLAAAIRNARALYAGGRLEEALQAYRAAQDAARRAGRAETAFELGYTRASIELESGRFAQAARGFLGLVADDPAAAQAADAHLLAAWCLGRAYEQSPTRENRLAYTEALEEHRERYAHSPTFHDAGWMLGLLEERRLQATAALTLYRTVPAGHRRGVEAQLGVARCHEAILGRLHDVLRNTPEVDRQREIRELLAHSGREAVEALGGLVASYPAGPARLSLAQAEISLRLSRVLLNLNVPEYERADALLERVIQSGEGTPVVSQAGTPGEERDPADGDTARWRPLLRTAQQLRIISLAGQGDFVRAERLVRSLSGSRAADVLGILDGLGELARDSAENTRFHVGQLQLRAAAELEQRRGELSPAEQQQLDLCLAEAFVAGGQSRDGVVRYERLLAAQPGNDRVRRRLAEVLEDACGTRECLDKARQHWRMLESAATPGTPAWLEARYHVTRCALKLDEHEEAGKLLRITALLYPELGGEVLRPRFEALQRELDERAGD